MRVRVFRVKVLTVTVVEVRVMVRRLTVCGKSSIEGEEMV